MSQQFLPMERIESMLHAGKFDKRLTAFYGVSGTDLLPYRRRIAETMQKFRRRFGEQKVQIFSVSGRTEIGGNHTDHQHGRVLAGGISLDLLAVAAPNDSELICIDAEGFSEICVSAKSAPPEPAAFGTSDALVRGVAAKLHEMGISVHGLNAFVVSDVPKGSGLSSSAAFEVLTAKICNSFFAADLLSNAELAKISQYAENVYFGKPCGRMDQMACALGGVCMIDFADAENPRWEQISLDLGAEGYALCILDSGADHADLNAEYAAIPAEMQSVAKAMGKNVLGDVSELDFWQNLPQIRKVCTDRALLRAIHFFGDTARVLKQADALKTGAFRSFLSDVRESGQSSVFALQNIYAPSQSAHQAVAVALAVCQHALAETGAFRVHGGGFAGTVQAYVPLERLADFKAQTEAVLGENACYVLQIRNCGAASLWEDSEVQPCCCIS